MKFDNWLLLIPRPIREFPVDLLFVLLIVGLTDLMAIGIGSLPDTVRIAVGLPFVLVLPGYVFVTSLYPEAAHSAGSEQRSGPDLRAIERFVMAVGLSIVLVPLVGLVMNFTPWGVRPVPMIMALSIITVVGTGVALVRRLAVPRSDRFSILQLGIPFRGDGTITISHRRVVSVVLGVLLITGTAGLVYSITIPRDGESFTELGLLTRDSTGELVADGYSSALDQGEEGTIVLALGNHEHQRMDYRIVVKRQTLQADDTLESGTVIDRFSIEVPANTTRYYNHTIAPQSGLSNARIMYLLYKSQPPVEPTRADAYRAVHFWINGSDPGTADTPTSAS